MKSKHYQIINTRHSNPAYNKVGELFIGTDAGGWNVIKLRIARGRKPKQNKEIAELFQDIVIALNNNGLKTRQVANPYLRPSYPSHRGRPRDKTLHYYPTIMKPAGRWAEKIDMNKIKKVS